MSFWKVQYVKMLFLSKRFFKICSVIHIFPNLICFIH